MTHNAKMLLVYIDETDRHGEVPMYEAIVRKLLHLHVSGATVQTGIMGYGRHHRLHGKHLLGVADDRPVTVTAIDSEETLRRAAGELRALIPNAPMLLVDVEVLP